MPPTRTSTRAARVDKPTDGTVPGKKVLSKRKPTAGPSQADATTIKRTKNATLTSKNGSIETTRPASRASTRNVYDLDKPIIITRSPILQLWTASVTQFLYPELSWHTCISIGNAVSLISAQRNREAEGIITKIPDHPQNEVEDVENIQILSIMGFSIDLHTPSGSVIIDGESKKLSLNALKSKFESDREYNMIRKVMGDGIDTWKGFEEGLDEGAFGMYEGFRPDVPSGKEGWGKKGQLVPAKILRIVSRK